jgi:hypothetical protein
MVITMIGKVMKALTEKDFAAFASCFSEDGKYIDYCPSLNGKNNYFLYGSASIEMFMRNRFSFGQLIIAEPEIEDENSATYFGAYEGPYQYAELEIEEYDEAGLIKKAVAHPAYN